MSHLIFEADQFADRAHASIGQVRKYTGAPYIEHPREVAGILASVGLDDATIAASLLHDVLEDVPGITTQMLTEAFGSEVATLVQEVTNVSRPEHGNRATRKALDRQHAAQASDRGQSIKLGDIISNCRNLVELDQAFAKVYLVEKREQVALLTRGHPVLHRMASQLIEASIQRLGEI